MTPSGWLFMFASLSFVVGLTVWCFLRVLQRPNEPGGSDRNGDGESR